MYSKIHLLGKGSQTKPNNQQISQNLPMSQLALDGFEAGHLRSRELLIYLGDQT